MKLTLQIVEDRNHPVPTASVHEETFSGQLGLREDQTRLNNSRDRTVMVSHGENTLYVAVHPASDSVGLGAGVLRLERSVIGPLGPIDDGTVCEVQRVARDKIRKAEHVPYILLDELDHPGSEITEAVVEFFEIYAPPFVPGSLFTIKSFLGPGFNETFRIRIGKHVKASDPETDTPDGVFVVVKYRRDGNLKTKFELVPEDDRSSDSGTASEWDYSDIGGLPQVVENIREYVEYPIRYPGVAEKIGLGPVKGILLTGPPGTGKTLVARVISDQMRGSFFQTSASALFHGIVGESEKLMTGLFEKARSRSPAVIFIDEIDAVTPMRESIVEDYVRRLVNHLLYLMDGITPMEKVLVIGATNRIHAMDPAFRRPGRFGIEIQVGAPDLRGREEILKIHAHRKSIADDVDFEEIARRTAGFVGADLKGLCEAAATGLLRRTVAESQRMRKDAELAISQTDFNDALDRFVPSGLRRPRKDTPDVNWADVVGNDRVRTFLRDIVGAGLAEDDLTRKLGFTTTTEILLTGEAGSGRKTLVYGLATEMSLRCLEIDLPSLVFSNDEMPEVVRDGIWKDARAHRPCIVLFPELDQDLEDLKMYPVFGRVVTAIGELFDRFSDDSRIFTFATAERDDRLPNRVRRRFDYRLDVAPLSIEERIDVLERNAPRTLSRQTLQHLAGDTTVKTPRILIEEIRRVLLRMVRTGWDPDDPDTADAYFEMAMREVL